MSDDRRSDQDGGAPCRSITVAYIAHAPLEPRAALAEWKGGRLTVWTGTQRPFGVRGELAASFQVAEEAIRVVVPDIGSAYGGKHTGEAAIEAVRLARAAAAPVKVIWTREEEFTWAYFRPAGVIDVVSGARADGTLTAWEFHNYNSGSAGSQTPYDIPNQRIAFHPSLAPLRQGAYRALAATANHFARETHMDELACAFDVDPLAFRLRQTRDARKAGTTGSRARGSSPRLRRCATTSCAATCGRSTWPGSRRRRAAASRAWRTTTRSSTTRSAMRRRATTRRATATRRATT